MRPAAVALLLAAVALLLAAVARADPAVDAARARQARFPAFAVEFTVAETVTHQVRPNEPYRQTSFEKDFYLTVEENRVRAESAWVGEPPPRFNFVLAPAVAVYDGELTRVLYPTGVGMTGQPEGLIDPSPRPDSAHGFIPRVVTRFVRPLDPVMTAYPLDRFTPTGATRSINGLECVEYTHATSPESALTYWLVPARDYVVARFEGRYQGRLTEETDVTYRPDPALGWVPQAWTTTGYTDAGAVRRIAKGRVGRWRVGIGLAAGPLDLVFPEGASVFDQRTSTFYRVKADGSWRELDALGNEVPVPGDAPWYRRYRWALVVAIVVGAVVLARVLRRRAGAG